MPLSISLSISYDCHTPGEAPQPECEEEGSVRLAGGHEATEGSSGGRVEVCSEGVWGSVCDHGFGESEAKVVCGQLGYTNCETTAIDISNVV